MNKASVYIVPYEHLSTFLPIVDVHLNKALEKTEQYIKSDIYKDLFNSKAQLWVGMVEEEVKGVVITHIISYPQFKALNIHLLGGEEIRDWIGEINKIEAYAKAEGCSEVELDGRVGWKKLLPEYEQARVTLTKSI